MGSDKKSGSSQYSKDLYEDLEGRDPWTFSSLLWHIVLTWKQQVLKITELQQIEDLIFLR